jgi:hypothetical protein
VVHSLLDMFLILLLRVYDDVNLIAKEDRQGSADPAEFGRERLNYTADMWMGKLDPAEHLTPGRHGEWTATTGAAGTSQTGMAWGVSVLPPGAVDPRIQDAIRRQQAR